MNVTTEILKRTDVRDIAEFLLYGTQSKVRETRSCGERIEQADNEVAAWFEWQFPDMKQREKAADVVLGAFVLLSEAYFELGLTGGLKLAEQVWAAWGSDGQKGGSKCKPKRKESW